MSAGPVGRDDSTAAFFDGTAAGQFLIRRCQPAGHASRPQARQCATCGSTELRWEPAAGGGRLVSWAVVPGRGVVAIVELDDGPWWWSELVGADPATLTEGQRLRLVFEQPEGGEAVPVFEPA
jgi:hypothetical protein